MEKIIDLLNKVANGEEAPKKIKYKDIEYEYNGKSYIDGFDDDLFINVYCNEIDLNEEVEIIEEKVETSIEERLIKLERDLKLIKSLIK